MNTVRKNHQYRKSKKRVLKYRKKNWDKVADAVRLAIQLISGAIELQMKISEPKFKKYHTGGKITVVGECGVELVSSKSQQLNDVLLPRGAKINLDAKHFHLLNHKTAIDSHYDKLVAAMQKTTSMHDDEIMKHYGKD